MSKNKLTSEITPGSISPSPRPAFEKKEYVLIYCSYGYLSSKTKNEVYGVLSKYELNSSKKYLISNYYEQNKPIPTLEPVQKIRAYTMVKIYKKSQCL